MPKFSQKKFMPYSCDEFYELVADIKLYSEFLPWCISSRVNKTEQNQVNASLLVGFQLIREKFECSVYLDKSNNIIHAEHIDGPFKYLVNHWEFKPAEGGCVVNFFVEFEFKSPILNKIMGSLFEEAVKKMVSSFEERARYLYPKEN